LHELGIERVELMTNNPQKIVALREHGIDVVGRISLVATTNTHNERYLRAKLERAGHLAEDAVDGSHSVSSGRCFFRQARTSSSSRAASALQVSAVDKSTSSPV
jgi:hypothetical protein